MAGCSLIGDRSTPARRCLREVCREVVVPLALPDATALAPLEVPGGRCTRIAGPEDVPRPHRIGFGCKPVYHHVGWTLGDPDMPVLRTGGKASHHKVQQPANTHGTTAPA
jgi:hypothetical protein